MPNQMPVEILIADQQDKVVVVTTYHCPERGQSARLARILTAEAKNKIKQSQPGEWTQESYDYGRLTKTNKV